MLLLASALDLQGGIEQFCRSLVTEIADLGLPDEKLNVAVVSLLDQGLEAQGQFPGVHFTCAAGRRWRYIGLILRDAYMYRPRLTIVGLVNFAPLALALRCLRWTEGYVVQFYGMEVWKRLRLHRQLAVRHSDAVSSITEYTWKIARRKNDLDGLRMFLLSPVVGWEWLQTAETTKGYDEGAPRAVKILTVARLDADEQQKGVDKVLYALARPEFAALDLEYVVVGEGTDRRRLEELASVLCLSSRVRFMGRISDEEVLREYDACDIYAMPSTQEGFGIVFIEAMARSKPVLAARFGGTPEVVIDGVTGILVGPEEDDELAAALGELCSSSELRQRLGVAGRVRVESEFSPHALRRQISGLLQEFGIVTCKGMEK